MHQTASPPSKYWNQLLAPYMKASNGKAAFQLLTTGAAFAANWLLMLWSLGVSYWLTLALALPAAGLLTRLFIFQHDCGHGAFFRWRRLNNVVGGIIGVLTLTPYRYWRRTHALHHGGSGDLDRRSFGDVVLLTVKEYMSRSRWGRLKYRVYRHPIVLLVVGPIWQFIIKHRLPWDLPRTWKKEWASVMWTNLGIASAIVGTSLFIGIDRFLLVQLPISLFAGALGIWLFYIQHQFEDTYWRDHPEWDFHRAAMEGSSYYDLPRVLHWFTGNIGYHHIHHLASRIPNYRLPECFKQLPDLHHVTRLTIRDSLRSARLHLWDEDSQRLMGFRQARELYTTS